MNLSQLIDRVQKAAQHTPAPSEGYTSFLKDIINEAYFDIWSQMVYDFNTKEEFIRVWPDYTSTDLGGVYITLNQGSDVAVFEAAPFPSSDTYREEKLVGSYLLVNNLYYRIENVFNETTIKLDRPWEQSSIVECTTYKIIHRYSNLPEDLIDLLGIEWADFPIAGETVGKSHPITRRQQTHMGLDSDISGNRPRDYVLYERDYAATAPMELQVLNTTNGSGSGDDYVRSATHYFGYTVVNSDGAESGMSDLLEYTADGTIATVEVGFEQTLFTGNATGWFPTDRPQVANTYNVYYAYKRPDTEGYRFYLLDTVGGFDGQKTATLTRDAIVEIKMGSVSKDFDPNAGTKKIRFYPRPSAKHLVDGTVNVSGFLCRYVFQPSKLISDYDTPIVPAMFHSLIVSRALVELHSRNSNFAAARYEEQKLNNNMKRLRSMHGSTTDVIPVRGNSMGINRTHGMGHGRMLNVSYVNFKGG